MSLITCCPACGTMFKVVTDQLKISDGWVRCGHCAQVFDATANMAPPATQAEPVSTAPPPPAPHAPAMRAAEAVEFAPHRGADTPPSDFDAQDAGAIEVEEIPVFSHDDLAQAKVDAAQADAELREVSFIRDARRRAFWSRSWVRAVLVLVLVALSATLAGQVALQERDSLAVTQPALKPWLEQACAALGCTVGAPRQIEAVAIDSSSFSKLRGDTYRLNFTLKNGASIPVATPSIELTLTDTQEQAVVRRVLAPEELGAAGALLPAGGEWTAGATVSVAVAGSNRISGYRLLVFYP